MDIVIGPVALFLVVVAGALAILGHKKAGHVFLVAVLLGVVASFAPTASSLGPVVELLGDVLVVVVVLALVAALGRNTAASRGDARRERRTSQKRRVERD